jgi:hypothetical protein
MNSLLKNTNLNTNLSGIINKYLDPTIKLWKYFKPIEFNGEFTLLKQRDKQ